MTNELPEPTAYAPLATPDPNAAIRAALPSPVSKRIEMLQRMASLLTEVALLQNAAVNEITILPESREYNERLTSIRQDAQEVERWLQTLCPSPIERRPEEVHASQFADLQDSLDGMRECARANYGSAGSGSAVFDALANLGRTYTYEHPG